MEAAPLKLTADNFPPPCSLRELIEERFGGAGAADAPLMERLELIRYLREMDNRGLSPRDAVLADTEVIGDPELPSDGDLAILGWVGEALRYWEHQFPVAEPLAGELRRLTPLLAAIAVSDPDFLVPGGHPVHRLLDTIQQAAVGWQPELGRAAQPMLQLVGDVVRRLLEWFESEDVDLARICDQAIATIDRDRERAARMAQRAEDAERVRRFLRPAGRGAGAAAGLGRGIQPLAGVRGGSRVAGGPGGTDRGHGGYRAAGGSPATAGGRGSPVAEATGRGGEAPGPGICATG